MTQEKYQTINSRANQWIKKLTKLQKKKHREQEGQFVVENAKIVLDALRAGHDFLTLFVTADFVQANSDLMKEIEELSRAGTLFLIDEKLNKVFSLLDTPSGIAAIYEIREQALGDGSVVYLNGISDPGNLGTIMRSALAFGFQNLVLDSECVDPFNPKVVAAAKDAIFKLCFVEDKEQDWLNSCSFPVYTTSSHQGTNLSDFVPAEKFCLVLGSESQGVDPLLFEKADEEICIAIHEGIESLNVGVAAGILFYELGSKK